MVSISLGKLWTLCELGWFFSGVGRPKDKSLDLQAAQVFCSVVTTDPGRPNQLSYIDQ